MMATSVRNPITGVDYLWPRAKQKVSVTDQRRVTTQIVPGADGAKSQYGLNAFPRAAAQVTISFRVTPLHNKTTFDALRTQMNVAVDHGRAQKLTFTDDAGNIWFATGYLIAKNLDADENQQWFADWSVTFLLEEPLAYGTATGVNAWGQAGLKWGQTGLKWGSSIPPIALASASVSATLANPLGEAETTDAVFTFTGQWGPVAGTGFITVYNSSIIDLNTGIGTYFEIHDTIPTGTTYQIDCGTSGTYKGGVPILGTVVKRNEQSGLMRLRGQGDNVLIFSFTGTPLSPLNGNVAVAWKPKKPLS